MSSVEPIGRPPAFRPELLRLLADNAAHVWAEIADAAARAKRSPTEITLLAVTKYVGLEVIAALLQLGLRELGENQVQQLAARARACGPARFGWPEPEWASATVAPDAEPAPPGRAAPDGHPRWHMIGHLQRNKVRMLLPHARIVHSVDSVRLAQTLERQAAELAPAGVDILIEVNVAGEATKEGVAPAEVDELAGAVRTCPHLRLRGLMTMAPYDGAAEASRRHFARLRELLDSLRERGRVGPECRHLSMGMSQDYTVAVEEGATLVRVGSVLFEGLPSADPRITT